MENSKCVVSYIFAIFCSIRPMCFFNDLLLFIVSVTLGYNSCTAQRFRRAQLHAIVANLVVAKYMMDLATELVAMEARTSSFHSHRPPYRFILSDFCDRIHKFSDMLLYAYFLYQYPSPKTSTYAHETFRYVFLISFAKY